MKQNEKLLVGLQLAHAFVIGKKHLNLIVNVENIDGEKLNIIPTVNDKVLLTVKDGIVKNARFVINKR